MQVDYTSYTSDQYWELRKQHAQQELETLDAAVDSLGAEVHRAASAATLTVVQALELVIKCRQEAHMRLQEAVRESSKQ